MGDCRLKFKCQTVPTISFRTKIINHTLRNYLYHQILFDQQVIDTTY